MALEQVQVAADDVQQVVEIVSDAPRQIADGLHFLAVTQGSLGVDQLCGARLHSLLERAVELGQSRRRVAGLIFAVLQRGHHGATLGDITQDDGGKESRAASPARCGSLEIAQLAAGLCRNQSLGLTGAGAVDGAEPQRRPLVSGFEQMGGVGSHQSEVRAAESGMRRRIRELDEPVFVDG